MLDQNIALADLLKIFIVASTLTLAGCGGSGGDLANDPDLLTDQDEIPERPGLIEEVTGEKLEKSW